MRLALTAESEEAIDAIVRVEPDAAAVIAEDLAGIELLGVDLAEVLDVLGSMVRISGASGRATFWCSPGDGDIWVVEALTWW